MPRLPKENGSACGRKGATRLLAPSRSLIASPSTSPRARTLTNIIVCQNLSHLGKQYIRNIVKKTRFLLLLIPKIIYFQGEFTKHKADAPSPPSHWETKSLPIHIVHICMYLDPHIQMIY